MEGITRFLAENNIGDVASILGVIIAIIGFAVIIINVWRSKKTVQQATQTILKVREDMLRANTVAEFSSALTSMEELKKLHRQKAWELLPERYSALRKSLISIRGANPNLRDIHKAALQSAIQHFSGLEKQVEESLTTNGEPPNVAKINSIVSRQINRLQEVLVEIRNEIGR